ncbi:MAG: hypothetical protein RL065_1602 [Bacteroidota bacterium]|jgi:hypothetical protein
MTFSQVCQINNNQIILNLPADFSGKKSVRVIVDDELDSKSKKIALLQMAATDKLFQDDVNEIADDFDNLENDFENDK